MIDMHLHSNWSDGSLNILELVNKLKENDLTHAVLTDHDCILGTDEFYKECQNQNIKTIPGVELEAYYDVKNSFYLHMLCYNYKDKRELNRFLEEERLDRIQAIEDAIIKLRKHGIYTTLEEVKKMSCGRHLLINHLCILLEKKGYVQSKFDAYNMFLSDCSDFYINYPKKTVEDIIEEINKVGGVAVLAHPMRIKMKRNEKESYVEYLAKLGIKGIETYYSFNNLKETEFSSYLANKYNLIETIGSDWHCEEEKIDFGSKYISKEKVKILKKEFFYE